MVGTAEEKISTGRLSVPVKGHPACPVQIETDTKERLVKNREICLISNSTSNYMFNGKISMSSFIQTVNFAEVNGDIFGLY